MTVSDKATGPTTTALAVYILCSADMPCGMTVHVCMTNVGPPHSLRVLYVDASSSKYAGSTDKKQMLDQLTSLVGRLPVDQCITVLQVSTLTMQPEPN